MTILFFDIETEAHPDASVYMPEPKAPANYKDEVKIAAYVSEKKAEQLERAALDPDYGRIIVIGWWLGDPKRFMLGSTIESFTGTEYEILLLFWRLFEKSEAVCGYNIINFDLPYIMRRTMARNLQKYAYHVDLRRYQTWPTIDLMQILYNWGPAKSLNFVAERYGLTNPLPDLDGSMVKGMDKEILEAYVKSDVGLVHQLYNLMKGIYF